MCGRYTLTTDGTDLWNLIEGTLSAPLLTSITAEQVKLLIDSPNRRKFNIVPTSYEPILLQEQGQVALKSAHWWIAPSWAGKQVKWKISAKGEKTFSWVGSPKSHFNSRYDTVTNPGNAYWHGLLEKQRCLIPADGFVEWPDEKLMFQGQDKIPKYFFLKKRKPFFFAGIYDKVENDEGKPFLSYNVLTVEPNDLLRALPHHRMPAILKGEAVSKWIDPEAKLDTVVGLLCPTSDEDMDEFSISKLVNNPRNDSKAILEPANSRHS